MENKYNNNLIKNADTRARREWIASALESVRAHLDVSTFQTSVLESQGYEHQGYEHQGYEYEGQKCRVGEPVAPSGTVDKPSLYLAWSDGQRRSGT